MSDNTPNDVAVDQNGPACHTGSTSCFVADDEALS